ncbi:MAG: hypothetical protein J6C82_06455 [Clostridia bacterium]|nr:hypothetical protein [Clostridia bacterium]
MKKLLYVLMFVFLLFTSAAHAEEIKIEGEDYAESNFTPTIKSGYSEFSGSAFMHTFNAMEKGQTYRVTYKVNADKKGGYNIKGVTTYLSKTWTTDYWIVVNGKEVVNAAEIGSRIKNISSSNYNDLFAYYDLGLIHLEEGENTITFETRGEDLRSDGNNVMWIDYFTLELVPFGIYSLTPYEDLGVFERKDKVEFSIDLVSECENNMSLPFEVKDFWRQTVLKGNLSVLKGADKVYLGLGKLDVGYYTLDVKCGDSIKTRSFAVTYNEEEYYDGESPFAMDFASETVLKNPKRDTPKYIRAAKLAGIGWLRERWSFGSFNTAQDKYNTDVDVAKTKYGMISDAGINLTVGFHDSPAYSIERGHYPADFMNVYWSYYYAAKTYGDTIDMWECWNEQDTAFASEPADEYSAFMKSMAIAIADADVGSTTCIGGFAGGAHETTFMDLCMQNGLLDYSEAYNCHVYGAKTSQDIIPHTEFEEHDSHLNLVYTYGDTYDTPLWVTEGGMARTIPTGGTGMTWQGQKEAAQGVVMGMTQSVARGTGKHFWFILPPYAETVNDFGAFSVSHEPYAHYVAYANYIYQLRKGDYKGQMTGLPDGAEGYIFNNGDHDVAVVWSDNANTFIPKSDSALKVFDIMGKEKMALAGEEINISNYPVFVHFEGEASTECYLPISRNIREIKPQTFTEAQKVVMCQRFYGTNYNTPRTDGYEITGGGADNVFNLEVYNYNDKEITATITGTPETDGFVIEEATKTITVAPKTKGILKFNIKTTDSVKYDVTEYLRFDGVIDGEEMSPSVSRIIARTPFEVEPDAIFENSVGVKNWTLGNASKDTVVTGVDTDDGGIKLRIVMGSGDKWAYPLFKVNDASVLKGTSGICFDVERDAEFTAFGMNVFLDLSDGRRYFLGNDKMMDVVTGQYVIPWTKFIMFSSPFGVKVDPRPFDATLIEKIEIGGNVRGTATGVPEFTVKNIGYYTSEFELSTAAGAKMEIIGVTDGAVYKEGEVPTAYATWNEDLKYKSIGVKLGSENYENFTVEGNNMTIDLSGLKRGKYRMMVYAASDMDYVYKDTLWFDVE